MTIQTDDARACAQIVRSHARTFTFASHFLPGEKRRAANAVYAFCRTADDIVDADSAESGAASLRLDLFSRDLELALDGKVEGPVFRELARAVRDFHIPPRTLRELLRGVGYDLSGCRYESWAGLASYCEGVASTVGEMCAHIFGVPGGRTVLPHAIRYARTLGVAMQVTNILRDVGEDAARGRCYLPDDDLAAFGLSRDEILACNGALARDERWRPMMAFEIGRARSLYEAAAPGIALLSPDTRRCATACAVGYAAILDAIEGQDYDTLTKRARVSTAARVGIFWQAWRDGGRERDHTTSGHGPFLRWGGPGSSEAQRWA